MLCPFFTTTQSLQKRSLVPHLISHVDAPSGTYIFRIQHESAAVQRLFCSPLPFQSDDEIDDETDVTGGPFISLRRVPLMYKRGICLIEKERADAWNNRPLTGFDYTESGPVMSKQCGISLTLAELRIKINLLRVFRLLGDDCSSKA